MRNSESSFRVYRVKQGLRGEILTLGKAVRFARGHVVKNNGESVTKARFEHV